MQDAIRFLERLGQHAAVGDSAYAALLLAEVADGQARQALLRRDVAALEAMLGGSAPWFCMVATPDGDESGLPQEVPDEHHEEQDDAPPQPAPERPDVPD